MRNGQLCRGNFEAGDGLAEEVDCAVDAELSGARGMIGGVIVVAATEQDDDIFDKAVSL